MTDDIQLVELSAVVDPAEDDHERTDELSDDDSGRSRLLWVALGVTAAVLLGLGALAVVDPASVEAVVPPSLGLLGVTPALRPRLRSLRRAVRRLVPFRSSRDESLDRRAAVAAAPSLDGPDGTADEDAEDAGPAPDPPDRADGDDASDGDDPPSISVSRLSDERDVSVLVDHLMRASDSRPLPDAFGVVSPIKRPLAATLEGVPRELGVRCRDVSPVLVGTANNETTVERLGRTYELLLVVTPDHEAVLSDVLRYLPALIRTDGVAGVGSVRTVTLPAAERPGTERESQGTLKALRGHKGKPRHPMARTEPDFIAASAPSKWTGPVRSVLSDYAPVIEVVEWDRAEIHVAGFVFASAVDLPDHVTASSDDSPGRTPAGTPSSDDADGRPTPTGGSTPTGSSVPADESVTVSPPESDGAASTSTTPEPSGERPPKSPAADEGSTPRDETAHQTTPDGGRASGGSALPRSSQSPPQTGGSAPEGDTPQTGAESDGSATGSKPEQDGPDRSNQGPDSGPKPGGSSTSTGGPRTGSDGDDTDAADESAEDDAEGADGAPDTGDDTPSGERAPSDDADTSSGTPSNPPNESAQPPSESDSSGPTSNSAEATPESQPATPESGPNRSASDGAPSGRVPSDDEASRTAPESETALPAEFPVPAGTTPGDEADSSPSGDGSKSPSSEPTTTRPERSPTSAASSTPETPADDIDAGAGIVPFGDAPASSDPSVVDVTEHVLNELTFQATATPGREVYSTVYADERGLIRHHHAIDHPDFLRSRTDSISFTSEFFSHLRRLASLHKDIDHRLAGGAHSHPVSGRPLQSGADKRFVRKVWRNTRNTSFIVGVTEGEGPDEWTITDDGREVRRQSNDHLVRIRAFSGRNEPKRIRLHQNMGQ